MGGILAGQSLIRAAELRSITNDYQRYQAAAFAFRDRYFYLPGDLPNALSIWPGAVANGNGNRGLGHAAVAGGPGENFTFWVHLTLAGLVEGTYTGLAGTNSVSEAVIGMNVPSGRITNSGWSARWEPTRLISDASWIEGTYGNILIFGRPSANEATLGSILVPEEAWNIDTKLDDGKPGMGIIRTFEFYAHGVTGNGCSNPWGSTTLAIAPTSVYSLSNPAINCSLIFSLGI